MYLVREMQENISRNEQKGIITYSNNTKLSLDYVISTVAGSGIEGYSGDGGKAVLSRLYRPYGVAVDCVGNIYVADSGNHCVRKVCMPLVPAIINQHTDTFVDKKYVYLKNILDGTIMYYTLDGSEPSQESFVYSTPFFITRTTTIKVKVYDPRNGSWSDTASTTYRKVADDGNIITLAGDGMPGYSGDGGEANKSRLDNPKSIAVDRAGNVYVADSNNHCVRKIDTHGRITTVAGTGKPGYSGDGWIATMARLYYPNYLVIDNNGNLYISDSFNNCIRKVDARGVITTIAGNRYAGYSGDGARAIHSRLRWPNGLALDRFGTLYVADSLNHCIRKIDRDGMIVTVAGNGTAGYSGDGGNALDAQLYCPQGIAVDNEGNIFVCDNNNNRIRRINSNGSIVTAAGTGMVGYSMNSLPAANADLNMPYGVVADMTGSFYIADTYNNCIRKVRLLFPESATLIN